MSHVSLPHTFDAQSKFQKVDRLLCAPIVNPAEGKKNTVAYVRHGAMRWVTWLIHICTMTQSTRHYGFKNVPWLNPCESWIMTDSFVCHDLWVPWLNRFESWVMYHDSINVSHGLWAIHTCTMTHSTWVVTHSCEYHDYDDNIRTMTQSMWVMSLWVITQIFTRVPWLIQHESWRIHIIPRLWGGFGW